VLSRYGKTTLVRLAGLEAGVGCESGLEMLRGPMPVEICDDC
jgi:hypothetical protein